MTAAGRHRGTQREYAFGYEWAAGLFEGEGCFYMHRHKSKESVRLGATLRMADADVVHTFAHLIGVGTISFESRQRHPNWKKQCTWKASGKDVEHVYRLLEPWLHQRRRQRFAELLAERRAYEERLPLIRSERAKTGRRTRVRHSFTSQLERLF